MGIAPFLDVDGLTKAYGSTRAVDRIRFSVSSGEVFGLLGPNGAGKTTTISMLCGLLKADAGNVTYDGISMSSHYNQVKGMIGLCPQEIVIWGKLTSMEQLKFSGQSYGLSPAAAGQRAGHLLHTLGLFGKRNQLAGTLSGGMQRRLNIALALVHDPRLIILDEPQAGLDPQSRVLVRDFIRQLAVRQKAAVILTTHDMDEADRLCDRVAIINHGKILQIDTPQKLKEQSGMGDVLQITLGGLSPDKTAKLLGSLPPAFVQRKIVDDLLLLEASDLMEHIPTVSRTLKALHIRMDHMTIRKRTLEDVFISMTGRGLRE